MMPSKSKQHVHSYQRIKSRPDYYMCTDPLCTHYTHKKYLLGKLSQCACGEQFTMDRFDLQKALPKCINCQNTKRAREYKNRLEIVRGLLGQHAKEIKDVN